MTVYQNSTELQKAIEGAILVTDNIVTIQNELKIRQELIDELIYTAMFSRDEETKKQALFLVRHTAEALGAIPASIYELYMAAGRGEVTGFTVPAFNVRTLTYDTARIMFKLAKKHAAGPFVLELARSEQNYTSQPPIEYAAAIMAAAVKENYQGPVFIQGDHYQFKPDIFKTNRDQEINRIQTAIAESLEAGFFNIDIDASTLVDLSQATVPQQQKDNYEMTALMTKFIRGREPKHLTVSIGGEIGHIGGRNSTVEDFTAFMDDYLNLIKDGNYPGISKVSVQTGTSHGGIPLPDGTIAPVNLDFDVLKNIGAVAREKYHIGGAVQHGASTLPEDLFDKFPQVQTLEIHLATGLQNIVYDTMPDSLKAEIYGWIKQNLAEERNDDQSETQFIYKTRKKAWGPFKQRVWQMSESEKKPILDSLERYIETMMTKLNLFNTRGIMEKHISV